MQNKLASLKDTPVHNCNPPTDQLSMVDTEDTSVSKNFTVSQVLWKHWLGKSKDKNKRIFLVDDSTELKNNWQLGQILWFFKKLNRSAVSLLIDTNCLNTFLFGGSYAIAYLRSISYVDQVSPLGRFCGDWWWWRSQSLVNRRSSPLAAAAVTPLPPQNTSSP